MTTPTPKAEPMLYPTEPQILRRRRLIVGGITAAILLISFITYGVLVHRAHSSTSAHVKSKRTVATPSTGPTKPTPTELPALPATSDPATFARDVAEALFSWDTTTLIGRDDHIEQLIKVGDPTGESTSGLLSDLDDYLPTEDAWQDLMQYETKQWLSIESVTAPTKWAQAQAQAGSALLPGTTALTIHGVRNRSGVWDGDPVTSAHDVAFTVFIVCGPSYPDCHLLRVSILDKPLD